MDFSCAVGGGELEGENDNSFSLAHADGFQRLILAYQRKKEICLDKVPVRAIQSAQEIDSDHLFITVKSIHRLRSDFWSRLIVLTNAYEVLPSHEHEWWNHRLVTSINKTNLDKCCYSDLPEFNYENVFNFVALVANYEPKALAKRVEKVFESLCSKSMAGDAKGFLQCLHVDSVINKWHVLDARKVGAINELLCLTSEFADCAGKIRFTDTAKIIQRARSVPGEWVELDSGRVKLAVFEEGHSKVIVDNELARMLNRATIKVGHESRSRHRTSCAL